MKALLQRVERASVTVDKETVGHTGPGICLFLGVAPDDTDKDIDWLAEKVVNLRIFDDDEGKMNLSLLDTRGELLVVSQFTLYGECRRGRRPSWIGAAEPVFANSMYEKFIKKVVSKGVHTETGVFQTMMKVEICNDGPVTLMINTRE